MKGDVALRDRDRVEYLKGYIDEAYKAIEQDGVKLKGYFHWSLMDNFEWADGFHCRFGLYRVNFDDPDRQRVAKDSAKVYREIVLNNGVC